MNEEYFTSLEINKQEHFINISNDPDKNDISKTIAINCKNWTSNVNKIMTYNPVPNEELDTPYYSRFKPIEFDSKRKYYWRANKLVQEGIRRSNDDDIEIAKVQALFDKETDPDKKQILQDELDLFKWRNNILLLKDKTTGLNRDMRDIETDYFPDEIGMSRPWIERHSHLPDYSY